MSQSRSKAEQLKKTRLELLDISTRNRLISTARTSTRSSRLEIVDELSEQLFRILVQETKEMTFLPAKEQEEDDRGDADPQLFLPQPEDDEPEGPAERHVDKQLQTSLSSEKLQKRLLQLYRDACTYEEEQGVNILYVALGFLKWYEDDKSDRERFAPLILVPVRLSRKSAGARFRIGYTEDDVTTNLSLQEKLRSDFGIESPDVPDVDDLSPNAYFDQVRQAIAQQPRWEVLADDIVLWFYSFSKFLMYRDLHPENWPENRSLDEHPLVHGLISEGFGSDPPIFHDDSNLDDMLGPLDMIHVTDADSSQAMAIEEVRQGRNLVIQGPPGTGKSQTITNLIATAVHSGKKVLFVAEKMAALEVVQRRLDRIGLGDMCLEVHSRKANKKAVLDELERTLALGKPKVGGVREHANQLKAHRDRLNLHSCILHHPLEPADATPYRAISELVKLRANGISPADFQLPDATAWKTSDVRARCNLIEDLVLHMRELGDPQQHPWRGVQLSSVLPTDCDRFASEAKSLSDQIDQLTSAFTSLANVLKCSNPRTLQEVSTLAQLAKRISQAPPMDKAAMADDVWQNQRQDIEEIIDLVTQYTTARDELKDIMSEAGWSSDVIAARRDFAAHGRSWWRLLSGAYRKSVVTLRGILKGDPPKSFKERLQIFDQLIAAQVADRELNETSHKQEIGRRAFGSYWRGVDTDLSTSGAILRWDQECREAQLPPQFRAILEKVKDPQAIPSLLKQVAGLLKPLHQSLTDLFTKLKLDLQLAFDEREVIKIPLETLKDRVGAWGENQEGLTRWIAYFSRCAKLTEQSLSAIVLGLDQGSIPLDEARDQLLSAYYEQLMREAFNRHSELASFDGGSHEQILGRFQTLDRERLQLTQQEVALSHFEGMPKYETSAGELGVLRREMKKKRRHLPLRRLLEEAGHAVQAIKPVMMMSPMSISQYLTPGVLEFDLLLIDEASQVQPVDALGAIARVKQMVVVGDERQLPPTTFFAVISGASDSESPDDAAVQAGDMESILGLCEVQGVPSRMLRWHYRSRHHSLIAVSNHEFYEDRLFVVPSPFSKSPELGVKFHHLPTAIFDRGRSRTNRVEAGAVADAVMEHACNNSSKTLGVGAFSVAQRDAILDELELRRRTHPELESFFSTASAEPFFVKNLENIQGDERDIILISIGYGKDSDGKITMNFGPLNNQGGERRLNVLISRARERCEIFSGITDDDIDLNRTQSRGVKALKTYLKYARTGQLDLPIASDRGHDSIFEEEVDRAISGIGYDVIPQTEEAGFFIDLAIVDPDQPGRYLLGIECDGASYHSSRWARDRDRLRQQVLEDRGWAIHRIWSTDWFHRPEEELRKVVAAIDAARLVVPNQSSADHEGNRDQEESSDQTAKWPSSSVSTIERHAADESGASTANTLSQPYIEASFPVDCIYEIHELPIGALSSVVIEIVKVEGPIHQDEIARRVTQLWGLIRTGQRISTAVEQATEEAEALGQLKRSGLFYSVSDQQNISIRDRSNVASRTLRKTEHVPPAEICKALEAVISSHVGVSEEEVIVEAAKLMGLGTRTSAFKETAHAEIRMLLDAQACELRNERIYGSSEII